MDRWQGCDRAPALAADLLGPRSGRFRHVAGVAAAAAAAGAAVPHGDLGLLVAAAWLHDIGYAAPAAGTGFHPLDGARFLRGIGAPDRLCRLVAHHTGARVEAAHRGLLDPLLEEFPAEASPAADALTYADLVGGPDGSPVAPAD